MKKDIKKSLSGGDSDFLHEEILKTFFKKSASKSPDRQKPSARRKKRTIFISSAALLALALSVNIIIIYINRVKSRATAGFDRALDAESLVKKGKLDRSRVEKAFFDGDAEEKSSFLKDNIKLVNSGSHGRASLVMEFRSPLDLENKNVLVAARSEHGTAKIKLILKDAAGRFYESAEMSFSSSWGMKHAYLSKNDYLNLKKVAALKVEFGTHTAGNKNNSALYLRNIIVRGVKEK